MIAPPLLALGVSLAAQPGVIWLLRRRSVLDHPTDRSSHTTATPRGGGLAVILGIAAGLASSSQAGVAVAPLALAVLLFGLLGAVEDLHGVDVTPRFLAQIVCGALVGLLLTSSTDVDVWIAVPFVAMWLAGYANAFNFMDGVNGISAMNAIVAGAVLAWIGVTQGNELLQFGGAVLAGASLGFLPWNAVRAFAFLGDSGSYALGAGIATLTGYAILSGIPLATALGPMALYLTDTIWTLQKRFRAGEVWHEAHRTHTYQRLTDVGWSHLQVAIAAAVVSLAVSVCGLVSLNGTPEAQVVADAAAAFLLISYLAAPGLLGRRRMVAAP